MATDLDVAIVVDLPEATDGVYLLPFALAENFLRFTPGSLDLGVVQKEEKIHLLAQGSQASFPTKDPEDYPPLPTVGEGALSAVVDGDDLVKALTAVVEYTATGQDRPVLSAVCLTLAEPMEAAAADGFRLAVRTLRSGYPSGEGRQALVPRKAVSVLERLWKLAPSAPETDVELPLAELVVSRRPVAMDYNGAAQVLRLGFGEVTLMVKLVTGTFPNYRILVPTTHTSRVTFHAQELLRAVRQLAAVAREGTGIVRLSWEGDRLTVAAKAEEAGEVEVALKATVEAPGRIAFNAGYLAAYLRDKENFMDLSTSDPTAPGVFTHQGTSVVISPMFLRDETPAKAEPAQEQPQAEEAPAAEGGEAEPPVEGQTSEVPAKAPAKKPRRKGSRRRKKQE